MLCRIITIIAILAPLATAVITPTAQCTCLPNMLPKTSTGMVTADGLNMSNALLGGTYGDSCGVQKELFSSSCVNSTGHPLANASAWCTSPWCWVDPCTCGLSDVARSSYFSANMYYSYSNCGGVDTYTSNTSTQSNLSATCSASSSPKSECVPRMANDYPLINCTGGIMGQCRKANVSGNMVNYPPSYGEGCGIHAEPGHSDCSNTSTGTPKANQAAWCKQPFSFVNPCECQSSDMAKSTYFPGLYYSYSVCGGNDTWTTAALQATVKAELNCPSPSPPPAPVQSPGNFPGSDPKDQKCACMPVTQAVPLVNCTSDYAQMGKCVNASKFPGFYPANYGATCGIHMEPLSDSCFDVKSGRPWKSPCRGDKTAGCRASWCDSAFCFVDPCTCTSVKDIAKSSWFPDANLFYSYENCKGLDTFSNSSEANKASFNRGEVCDTSCRDLENAYETQSCCTSPEKKFAMPTGTVLKQMVTKSSGMSRRLSSAEMAEDLKMTIKAALEQAAAHEDPGQVVSLAKALIGHMQGYTNDEQA